MLRPGKSPSNNGLPMHSESGYSSGGFSSSESSERRGSFEGYRNNGNDYYAARRSSAPPSLHSPRRGSYSESSHLKVLKQKWLWLLLLSVLFLSSTLHYRGQQKALLSKLNVKTADEALRRLQDAEREKKRWRKDNQDQMYAQEEYKKKITKLKKENGDLRDEKEQLVRGNQQALQDTVARHDAMQHQIFLLQNATSRESKRALLDRFGPGPHYYVQFIVKLPNKDADDPSATREILVETAHFDLVPHAVHLFLEQVSHKLWDGTHFYINGPHVTQAGPYVPNSLVNTDVSRGTAHKQKFADFKLDQLAFPEYSPDFPHLPLTLGYAGRPGGPDFYINKGNNTIPHGPGGQKQHGLQEQADSCFARVVEGQDVLRFIHDLPTYPKGHQYRFLLMEPVEIMSAQILDRGSRNQNGVQNVDEHVGTDETGNEKTVIFQKPKYAEDAPAA